MKEVEHSGINSEQHSQNGKHGHSTAGDGVAPLIYNHCKVSNLFDEYEWSSVVWMILLKYYLLSIGHLI